ncbi:Na-Ca exchanger/integrin-beta4 [Sulfuricurvum kujiense DSM 16994]|uniref:Na-Ca exchanger/integrin-beta4 n=1 Tax=Sulfuricurvum kujiense (strain ATCC BAA-921 / DSM 16994 / JCM 11577 / YK-1) TaxID=709032 RepID=E4U372_SULKY|nr:trypsin-like serine protease [Sulfuricurvum kujiense]ADR34769.1 Na-Ca exchanger/integrin-beta4 [Sulfuricurvum kujiense DSM 16994]
MTTQILYTDIRSRALPGEGYDGVVRISAGGYYGTGVLLYDGRAVLTAAHLFDNINTSSATVYFETVGTSSTLVSDTILIHPGYDARNENYDLALIWLSSAPTDAERYTLYRQSDEISQTFTAVGYGRHGSGEAGVDEIYNVAPLRLKAQNKFDVDGADLKFNLGSIMGWAPVNGVQLMADFDDGTIQHDALGELMGRWDRGIGIYEGLIAPGDSGGPAFIGDQVAGIASYVTNLGTGYVHPDIDNTLNSSFGEVAGWQSVSTQQQWIDQNIRAHYIDPPQTPLEVQKSIVEGNSGTQSVYFMLTFTGVRSDPAEWLSVDFSTRDGSAVGGEDYIETHGRLVLYPDENQALIPVEVIGDTVSEMDETFYLDVFNPVGGSFGEGITMLTAVRTIIDNDSLWV